MSSDAWKVQFLYADTRSISDSDHIRHARSFFISESPQSSLHTMKAPFEHLVRMRLELALIQPAPNELGQHEAIVPLP